VAAGGALIAAGIAGLLFYAPGTERYTTDIGEMRQVTLAEGSSLSLDTQTSLKVEMESDARVVKLAEGRTLLRVRHDAARPFRVQAGAITITDIGTVFQVIRRGDAVTVLVSEGMVEIAAPGGKLRLGAGQTASFDGKANLGACPKHRPFPPPPSSVPPPGPMAASNSMASVWMPPSTK
jgi:transmembrane sensor